MDNLVRLGGAVAFGSFNQCNILTHLFVQIETHSVKRQLANLLKGRAPLGDGGHAFVADAVAALHCQHLEACKGLPNVLETW